MKYNVPVAAFALLVCTGAPQARDVVAPDNQFIFALCGYGPAVGNICFAPGVNGWQSYDQCMADRAGYIIGHERQFGPLTQTAIDGYRCIGRGDWDAPPANVNPWRVPAVKPR